MNLRGRLILLVLAVLLPAIAVAGILLWDIQREAARTQQRQLIATARTLALVIDRQIAEQAGVANALSASPALLDGDWAEFDAEARAALHGSANWVVVRRADGQQMVNTRVPFGTALPRVPNGDLRLNLAGGRDGVYVSNLLHGPVAQAPVVVVLKAVTLRDGARANVSVVTEARTFSDLLVRQDLPTAWTAAILDGSQTVVGRNRDAERFTGRPATADVRRRVTQKSEDVMPSRTLDGVASFAAYKQLPDYHWTALVAVPRAEAAGAARASILVGLLVGVLLLAGGVLLALRLARQVAAPVERLALAAAEWEAGRPVTFPAATGLPETDGLGRAFSSALRAVEDRDARQKLLINELNHRVKNTLATVQSVALHSRRGAASVDDYHAALEGRVMAMSGAHELLTRTAWESVELGELARLALRPFAGPRLRIAGPIVQIGPTDALNLSLIFYELATNAAKHGALSGEAGEVSLTWRRTDGRVRLDWVERGGPSVSPPTRQGFGSRLITRAARELQPSHLSYAPEGVRCSLTLTVSE